MKKLTNEWNNFTKELKNSKKYSWLQRLSKEEKENLNWIVKEGHTLKNKQKNEIIRLIKIIHNNNDVCGNYLVLRYYTNLIFFVIKD